MKWLNKMNPITCNIPLQSDSFCIFELYQNNISKVMMIMSWKQKAGYLLLNVKFYQNKIQICDMQITVFSTTI